MKNRFYYIFIATLVVIVFFLGRQCSNSSKNDLKPVIDTLILHKVDTIRDTISVFKTKIKIIFRPVYISKPVDTNKYKNIPEYRVYQDTTKDSNVVIYSNDTVLGYLTSKQLSYKLLVPLKIYDSTKVIITKQVPILPKYQLKLGSILSTKSIIPSFELDINKSNYEIGYDPFNKIPYIGYKYTIWSK